MQALRTSLSETIQFTDAVIQDRLNRRQAAEGRVNGVPWREDATMKTVMTDLRSQAQIISHSAVKLALLVNTAAPGDRNLSSNLRSIGEEVTPQIITFYNIFLRVTECDVADCLFDEAAQCVRSLLGCFNDLVLCVAERKREAINYTAGEITKIQKDVIEGLPLANKAAYRRFLLKKCMGLKEIIEEFSNYVQEAKASAEKEATEATTTNSTSEAAGESDEVASVSHVFSKLSVASSASDKVQIEDADNEDEDRNGEDDEDDMDERDYFPEEVEIVEEALLVIQRTLDSMKVITVAMTQVADSVLRNNNKDSSSSQVEGALVASDELVTQTNVWVAETVQAVSILEGLAVDLGAALYPPVYRENEDLIEGYDQLRTKLIALCGDFGALVCSEAGPYRLHCEVKIADEVQRCFELVRALPSAL